MNTVEVNTAGFGIQAARLLVELVVHLLQVIVASELYNGTNWTEVNDLNTGRERLATSGVVLQVVL